MSKLIHVNDYIRLSTYAKKYGICNRKLYRHLNDDSIDYVIIDTVRFIRDEPFSVLESDNRSNYGNSNVEPSTIQPSNVEGSTIASVNYIDNQEVNNVEPLTIGNVKPLTMQKSIVTTSTLRKRLNELESIPENELKIKDYKEIDDLIKKINAINQHQ